jgi:hypothetical protein
MHIAFLPLSFYRSFPIAVFTPAGTRSMQRHSWEVTDVFDFAAQGKAFKHFWNGAQVYAIDASMYINILDDVALQGYGTSRNESAMPECLCPTSGPICSS